MDRILYIVKQIIKFDILTYKLVATPSKASIIGFKVKALTLLFTKIQ